MKPFKVENAELFEGVCDLLWIAVAPPPGLINKASAEDVCYRREMDRRVLSASGKKRRRRLVNSSKTTGLNTD